MCGLQPGLICLTGWDVSQNTSTKNISFKGIYSQLWGRFANSPLKNGIVLYWKRNVRVPYWAETEHTLFRILIPALSCSVTNELTRIFRMRIRFSALVQLVLLAKNIPEDKRHHQAAWMWRAGIHRSQTLQMVRLRAVTWLSSEKKQKGCKYRFKPMWQEIVRGNL